MTEHDKLAELERRLANQEELIRIQSMTMAGLINWIFINQDVWKRLEVQAPGDLISLLRHIMKPDGPTPPPIS